MIPSQCVDCQSVTSTLLILPVPMTAKAVSFYLTKCQVATVMPSRGQASLLTLALAGWIISLQLLLPAALLLHATLARGALRTPAGSRGPIRANGSLSGRQCKACNF